MGLFFFKRKCEHCDEKIRLNQIKYFLSIFISLLLTIIAVLYFFEALAIIYNFPQFVKILSIVIVYAYFVQDKLLGKWLNIRVIEKRN